MRRLILETCSDPISEVVSMSLSFMLLSVDTRGSWILESWSSENVHPTITLSPSSSGWSVSVSCFKRIILIFSHWFTIILRSWYSPLLQMICWCCRMKPIYQIKDVFLSFIKVSKLSMSRRSTRPNLIHQKTIIYTNYAAINCWSLLLTQNDVSGPCTSFRRFHILSDSVSTPARSDFN